MWNYYFLDFWKREIILKKDHPVIKNLERNMVYVKGGTFMMGDTSKKTWWRNHVGDSNERPCHRVSVSDFYIGKFVVTMREREAVMGEFGDVYKNNPYRNYPACTWKRHDVNEFIAKLNIITGKKFRLPTEAEWEYAARGGMNRKGCKFAGSNELKGVGWNVEWTGNWNEHEVGQLFPNEIGLYDTSGLVWELCSDEYETYTSVDQINPQGPTRSRKGWVIRGGSVSSKPTFCRVSARHYACGGIDFSIAPTMGIRLVLNRD